MAISKIKTGSIEDGTIATADLAAGAVTTAKIDTAYTTSITTNPVFSGTGSATLPSGTTEQRPASPVAGMLRYNTTTGYLEQYNATGWTSIASAPIVTSVSPTTFNGNSGTTFTINGSFFDSSATVKFITTAGVEYYAGTVTFVSASELTATTPQNFTVADEPLSIKVINSSGLTYTLGSAIDCGGVPSWSTSSGTVATVNDKYGSYSTVATLAATDPEGGAVTYSITSGTVPAGMSFNTSTGVISGDPTDLASGTTSTSNFTVAATDGINTTSRAFNVVVNLAKDGTTSARAGTGGAAIKTLNSSSADGTYYIDPYTNVSYSNPQQYTVDMTNGGWTTVPLATLYNTVNNNKSYMAGFSGVSTASSNASISWDGTWLRFGNAGSSNNGYNWYGFVFDRAIMGRAAEFNGWRDWDVTFRTSYDWGWGVMALQSVNGMSSVAEGTNTSVGLSGASAGSVSVSVYNNQSNNMNVVYNNYYHTSNNTQTSQTLRSTGGNGTSTTYRATLVAGIFTYYINGSQVGQYDLTAQPGTPATSSTKWVLVITNQSPCYVEYSSIKVK